MPLDNDVSLEEEALLKGLAAFVDHEVTPLEEANRELFEDPSACYAGKGGYSPEVQTLMRQVRNASADAGFYTMFCPEEIGGGGLGALMHFRAWEYLYHYCGPGRLLPTQVISHWSNGPSFLMAQLSPSLKDELLAKFMHGDISMCFAMSEPDAGSDAWSMGTRAVRDGDEWVINGSKQWISHSPHAEYALIFAVTNEELRGTKKGGVSAFMVPTSTPGFSLDSVIKLFGESGGNEGILSFTDMRVPAECLVGELDKGFALAIGGVSMGRMYNAGRCVGLARWALELATGYSKSREAFGHPISEYQGVSFQLADSAIEIYAAKTMSVDCGKRIDRGERVTRELAMVKAYATEMCFRVYDRCMQVHGGMGLTNEMRLYAGWHSSRAVRVADGSGEIMRRAVVKELLAGNLAI